MNLAIETYRFARWTVGVTRRFMRYRPAATVAVTLASAVDGVLQLIAFLVPLKIILLAASPGIPAYFPFIDPANKTSWVIGLALGAVSAYLTSLVLSALSDRWSRSAGRDVLRGANDLAVHAREEEQVQRAFNDFTRVIASVLFLAATGAVLVWADPRLASFLIGMTSLLALVSMRVLAATDEPPPRLKSWLMDKTKQYLGLWRAMTFFGAIGVIIFPFLTEQGGNIFLAIIGFIMLRQMLGNITAIIAIATGLVRRRTTIDALIYRSQQVIEDEAQKRSDSFRALFAPVQRNSVIGEALRAVSGEDVAVQSIYVDPVPAPVKRFDVVSVDSSGENEYLEARVFPANCQDQVTNAEFLFEHVPRSKLSAPSVWTTFNYYDYTIVVQEAGSGERYQADQAWKAVEDDLVTQLLLVTPPRALIKSYNATKRLLPDRLSRNLLDRLWIGVDNQAEAQRLEEGLRRLDVIKARLRTHPVALFNPDFLPTNTIVGTEKPLIMAWGRWMIEPIGTAMARYGCLKTAESRLSTLKHDRQDLTDHEWIGDLALGADCHRLEQAIYREQHKQGLEMLARVLEALEMRDSHQSVFSSAI